MTFLIFYFGVIYIYIYIYKIIIYSTYFSYLWGLENTNRIPCRWQNLTKKEKKCVHVMTLNYIWGWLEGMPTCLSQAHYCLVNCKQAHPEVQLVFFKFIFSESLYASHNPTSRWLLQYSQSKHKKNQNYEDGTQRSDLIIISLIFIKNVQMVRLSYHLIILNLLFIKERHS